MTTHTDPIDEVDLANLAALHELLARVDPVPADLAERSRFALTVHALHAEVAELTQAEMVATRSAKDATRTESITFTSGTVSLMVTTRVGDDGRTARIDGWVTRGGAVVDVVTADLTRSVTADEHGRFVVDGLPRGWVHFLVRVDPGEPDARPVITPSVEL